MQMQQRPPASDAVDVLAFNAAGLACFALPAPARVITITAMHARWLWLWACADALLCWLLSMEGRNGGRDRPVPSRPVPFRSHLLICRPSVLVPVPSADFFF